MSLKSLILFLFMAMYAVSFSYSKEVKVSGSPAKDDSVSFEDAVVDALIDELKSEIESKGSDDEMDSESGSTSKSQMQTSQSRFEDAWLEPDSEPSLFDDPDENDALHSRAYTSSNKRDEYYENLEKKSQRSTYVPPPRKNFYTTPENIDSSASEEYVLGERRPDRRPNRRPSSSEEHHEDYRPRGYPTRDAARAETHHLVDSLDIVPSRVMHQPRPLQTPPWRFIEEKSFPREHMPLEIVNERPRPQEPLPVQLIPKATVAKHHSTFKMASSAARRPAPPLEARKRHYKDDGKFAALPKSKPWATEYTTKETLAPKFTTKDDRPLGRSAFGSGFGKATRQQFHEQGIQGPNSYKFGYNTGDKENPMARYEERDADGIVRGSYSFIDARGEKQVVHYESHPKFGFKTKLSSGL